MSPGPSVARATAPEVPRETSAKALASVGAGAEALLVGNTTTHQGDAMPATLKPAPVSSRQFTYDATATHFSAEISSTHGLGRVYADACDEGLTVVSSRTGAEVVFVVEAVEYDREGDLTHWNLKAVGRPFTMTLWND